MAEPKKAGLFRYLKEAFLFRWNLLLLGGAGAAAAPPNISRFQRYVNASLR